MTKEANRIRIKGKGKQIEIKLMKINTEPLFILLSQPRFKPSLLRKFFDSKNDSEIASAFEKWFNHFKLSNPNLYRHCLELFRLSLSKLLQSDSKYFPGAFPTIFRAFLENEIRIYENFSWSLENQRLFQDFMVYLVNWNINSVGSQFEWTRRKNQNVLLKYKSESLPRIYAFLPKKNCVFDYYSDGWENRLSDLAKTFVEAEFDSDKIGALQVRDLVEAVDFFAVQLQFYLPEVTGSRLLPQLIIFLANLISSDCRTQKRTLGLEGLSEALSAFAYFKIQNARQVPIRLSGVTVSHISVREFLKYYDNFIETVLRVRSKLYSAQVPKAGVLDEDLVDTLLDAAAKEAA